MLNWIKSLFCEHDFKAPDPFRGFFGIIECQKCHKFDRLPDDQMVMTEFNLGSYELSNCSSCGKDHEPEDCPMRNV